MGLSQRISYFLCVVPLFIAVAKGKTAVFERNGENGKRTNSYKNRKNTNYRICYECNRLRPSLYARSKIFLFDLVEFFSKAFVAINVL